jgi:predicted nucleic acid-binding protein
VSRAWVIDASVGFAWVHPDQATPATDSLLAQIEAGAAVVVPALWFAEMANTLLVLQRRKKLTAAERKAALETLSRLNFTVDEEAGRAAFQKTSELAEKHGLSVYDAIYLEIALRRKLPLASRDNALLAAARRCHVRVL